MTVLLLVKCQGSWDAGRFPCRATLPVPAHRVTRAADPDALDAHAARIAAWEAGWWVADPDAGGEDLCPAHARHRHAELMLAAMTSPPRLRLSHADARDLLGGMTVPERLARQLSDLAQSPETPPVVP